MSIIDTKELKLPNLRQMLTGLSIQKDLGSFEFNRAFTKKPFVGLVVRHNGEGNRKGWIGVVAGIESEKGASEETSPYDNDYSRLNVIWFIQEDGNSVTGSRHNTDIGICQSYAKGWVTSAMESGSIYNRDIREVVVKWGVDRVIPAEPEREPEKPVRDPKEGLFLVWGPNGSTNPQNPAPYKQCLEAAKTMTKRHNAKFFVVKLVVEVNPVVGYECKESL